MPSSLTRVAAFIRPFRWHLAGLVLVTGFPHHEEAIAALKFGPAMLLKKPVKLPDIESVLQIVFKE